MPNMLLVKEIIHEAGDLALRYEGENCQISRKADGSIVTQGDKAVGKLITHRIMQCFPNDLVIQEETADFKIHTPDRISQGCVWVVDPIDGTNSFVDGLPFWSINLGIFSDGKLVDGVVFFPRMGELYHTSMGQAFCNGKLISTEKHHHKKRNSIGTSSDAHWKFDFKDFDGYITAYNSKHNALLVARGLNQAAHMSCRSIPFIWDIAGIIPIVEQAGGEFRYLSGEPFQAANLFDISKRNDRDALFCRKGEFEQVIKYFAKRN